MKRRKNLLDRVRVPRPCDARWEEMRSGRDAARLCERCDREVHNLAGMTRDEAERLLANAKGRVCVRLERRDGRAITADDHIAASPLYSITRHASRIAAAGAFSAALTFMNAAAQDASQQTNGAGKRRTTATAQSKDTRRSGRAVLIGRVLDANADGIADTNITLTDAKTGQDYETTTDAEGRYRLDMLPSGAYTLTADAAGFAHFGRDRVLFSERTERRIDIRLDVAGFAPVGDFELVSEAENLLKPFDERSDQEEHLDEATEDFLQAAEDGDADELQAMIRQGANVNAANQLGETALILGAGDKQIVKLLLKAKADVHARTRFGVTPLMYAALSEDASVARMMIKAGAEVNARDAEERTALMFAALDGNLETVKVLLAAGADTKARDKNGKSVFEFGIESDRIEIVNLLRAAGARE